MLQIRLVLHHRFPQSPEPSLLHHPRFQDSRNHNRDRRFPAIGFHPYLVDWPLPEWFDCPNESVRWQLSYLLNHQEHLKHLKILNPHYQKYFQTYQKYQKAQTCLPD
jgi:hypothetical protein